MPNTHWECQLCFCSFSGHCDEKELKTHVAEDHNRPDAWFATPDEFEDLFKKRVVQWN
jgi:hypothetical protein